MSEFALRVSNPRTGAGRALMFFDVDLGYTDAQGTFVGMLTAKGFTYKMSNEGKPYFQGPSKLRVKNGEPVKNERGYDQYDEFIVLYGEKGANPKEPAKFAVTEAGWAARTQILEQAGRAYAQLTRRATPAAAAKQGATSGTSQGRGFGARTGGAERGWPGQRPDADARVGSDDEDLPF